MPPRVATGSPGLLGRPVDAVLNPEQPIIGVCFEPRIPDSHVGVLGVIVDPLNVFFAETERGGLTGQVEWCFRRSEEAPFQSVPILYLPQSIPVGQVCQPHGIQALIEAVSDSGPKIHVELW